MAQGVKFDPSTTSNMEEISVKYRGNVAAIAQHYNVSRFAIYEYFKSNPEGMDLINKIRQDNHESFLDQAEFVLQYALSNYKTNMHYAMRAADKVIDKKGHTRGWKSKEEDVEKNTIEAIDKLDAMLDKLKERRQPLLNKDETKCINDNKS